METFLKLVANHLYSKYQNDIQDICMVFPGRRAGLFFMRHYKEFVKDKPLWVPPVRTISELISDMSNLQIADPVILIFELYKVFRVVRNSDETFDSFYPFGEMLLNDFDDIDKYLVDTSQIFQNISDLKDIENKFSLSAEQIELIRQFWKNVNLYEPGPVKRDFIGIWNHLNQIYSAFTKVLSEKGIAYEGMVYREVCNNLKEGNVPGIPFKKFAIIGFNALNECEKVFFTFLQKNNLVDFYWDYDQYYIQNKWHEAGFFIRENLDKFPNSLPSSMFSNLTGEKDIQIISAPSDLGQAKLIPTLLESVDDGSMERNDTVIVLADEQLLIPILSSIPQTIKEVNVTLGYPFRLTHVYSFFELLLKLQKSARNMGGIMKFYHRDVLALLNHSYPQIICETDCQELIGYIINNNQIFLTSDDFRKNDYLKDIFRIITNTTEYLDYLAHVGNTTIDGLKQSQKMDDNTNFELDYWFTFLTAINRLKETICQDSIEIGIPILFRLLKKVVSALSTPFKGEPLAGLQVMGVLETRAIDFSNVIILSANEGIFPKSDSSASYIPYNLRKGFGLPTIEHQDAIFAYYFYRLIQRAKKVVISYNSQPSNRAGEMSRYLYQLRYENVFSVKEKSVGFSISLSDEKPIAFPKSKPIMDFLLTYIVGSETPRYLTPTALSAYMVCSLKFYFRYIAKIKEKEEITEDIEGSVFGKLLHSAMENIYKPITGQLITDEVFGIINNPAIIDQAIMDAFGSVYFKSNSRNEILHGKSILIKEILKKYISEILNKDKQNIPFTILSLEKSYQMEFGLGENKLILGGVIDRLDLINDSVRIIDYKTGHAEFSCPSIPALFDRDGDTSRYSAIFQSMLYALVIKNLPEYASCRVYPGIYGLRKIFTDDFDCSVSVNKSKIADIELWKDEYENSLREIVSELFNPSISFVKTDNKKKCEICAYKEICHR
jgi:CRISPR/Cas system-associated exonuclease Cas4 (RecB family)